MQALFKKKSLFYFVIILLVLITSKTYAVENNTQKSSSLDIQQVQTRVYEAHMRALSWCTRRADVRSKKAARASDRYPPSYVGSQTQHLRPILTRDHHISRAGPYQM